jgi:endonuclease/exonuclease/phosphatase family metal-dependent hydrolase
MSFTSLPMLQWERFTESPKYLFDDLIAYMKVTSWNIQHGEVYSLDEEIVRTTEIKRCLIDLDCDVLLLQEVDHLNARTSFEDQTKEFAEIMGAPYWVFAPSVWRKDEQWHDWPSGPGFPELVSADFPTDQPGYGISIISKIPIVKWSRKELHKAWFGWWLGWTINGVTTKSWVKDHARNAVAAYFEDGTVLINTHLSWEPFFRRIQLIELKRWANKIARDKSLRVFIVGDLNIPSGWIKGVDSWNWRSTAHQLTFPAWQPEEQIDHFLTKAGHELTLHPTVTSKISDHLPISISI